MPLLSDFNAEAVHAFEITQEFRGLRDVAVRSAFIIDRGGTVSDSWRYGTGEVPDLDQLLAAARALPAAG